MHGTIVAPTTIAPCKQMSNYRRDATDRADDRAYALQLPRVKK